MPSDDIRRGGDRSGRTAPSLEGIRALVVDDHAAKPIKPGELVRRVAALASGAVLGAVGQGES